MQQEEPLLCLKAEFDKQIKVVVVGDSNVGKTNLIQRYIDKNYIFLKNFPATVGLDYKIKILNNPKVKLQIWDTAGQERKLTEDNQTTNLTSQFFRGASAFIIAFSVTDKKSLEDVSFWLKYIKNNSNKDAIKVIVGTKMDKIYKIEKNQENKDQTNKRKLKKYNNIEYIQQLKKKYLEKKPLFAEEFQAISQNFNIPLDRFFLLSNKDGKGADEFFNAFGTFINIDFLKNDKLDSNVNKPIEQLNVILKRNSEKKIILERGCKC